MIFTIKNKLIVGFVVIVMGVLFLGGKSIANMGALASLTDKMYMHPLTVTKASLEADVAIISMQSIMKDIAYSKSSADIKSAVLDIDVYEAQALKQLDIVKKFILGEEGRLLIAETISVFMAWKPIRQQFIHDIESAGQVNAIDISTQKGVEHVQKISSKMDALTKYAATKARGFRENAKKRYQDSMTIMLTNIGFIFVVCVGISIIILKQITQPLTDLKNTIDYIGQHSNLTKSVPVHRDDEFGSIANHFNVMMATFKKAIGQVAHSSEGVAQAASHTATINTSTQESIASQNNQLHELTTSVKEMTMSIAEVAKNTALAASSAESAGQETAVGAQLVLQTSHIVNEVSEEFSGVSNSIQQLEVQGKNVTSVLSVINGIAEQTNLLALNAAIEAARAGEQGRGFSVVADEVRTLAQRTQGSTSEIETMLSKFNNEIQHAVSSIESGHKKVNGCVKQAKNASESLNKITLTVETIKDMSDQIALSTEEQTVMTNKVNSYIDSIANVSEKTLNDANQCSNAMAKQVKMAEELKKLSSQFIYS